MSLTLAIPSKGRLKEQALEVLARAGLAVRLPKDERRYSARVDGRDDIDVAFLSASEIAGEIGQGAVDLGITGEDLLRENVADWEARAEIFCAARLRPCRRGGGRARHLAGRGDHGRPGRRCRRLPPAPRAPPQDRHQYWRLTQQFFTAKQRHTGLSHRGKPRRHGRARRRRPRPTSSSTSPPAARRQGHRSRCWPTGRCCARRPASRLAQGTPRGRRGLPARHRGQGHRPVG